MCEILPPFAPLVRRACAGALLLALAAVSSVPLFRFRLPNAYDGLRRLDRGSGVAHRPATAMADEMATTAGDPWSAALWWAHVAWAVGAAR